MKKIKWIPRMIITVILFLIFFFPFYWMLVTSVKTLGETVQVPPTFFPEVFQWENFKQAFEAIPFLSYLKNSVIVTAAVLILQMLTIVPCAYAFARYRLRDRNFSLA